MTAPPDKGHSPDGLTLEMVLQNQSPSPYSLRDFVRYLEQTYCVENLAFYMAVEDYRQSVGHYFGPLAVAAAPGKTMTTTTTAARMVFDLSVGRQDMLEPKERIAFESLKAKFEDILQRFIFPDAVQEINIPCEMRQSLLQSCHNDQSYHPALLGPACSAVVELLRISAFIPFATDPDRLATAAKGGIIYRPAIAVGPMHRLRSNSLALASPQDDEDHNDNDAHHHNHHHHHNSKDTSHGWVAAGQPPSTDEDHGLTSTFLRKLTSPFRFRARSQSPPPRWRQINIDPRALAHPPPTTMERGNSTSSTNTITSTNSDERPKFTLSRSRSSASTDISSPSPPSSLSHSLVSFLPELPAMTTHFFHPFELRSAHDGKNH
ncbi:hypothetical protein DFQ28_008405 [Apophysomyces sp. BC1034]|nr:hypothetical protein DFQ30_007939 [Apophysomyces sp. BC1015]KAG0192656.1 hypothetical protein DFQ28_008405 [Apophysomyces sp. BC1034]